MISSGHLFSLASNVDPKMDKLILDLWHFYNNTKMLPSIEETN